VTGTPFALDPAVGDDIRRIGLEALTNAFRHAHAETIEVEITYEKAKLRLTVRDDGSGMDEDILQRGRSGHWGLFCMRERAERLGAALTIWSHPGAGTEICLTIPSRVAGPRARTGAGPWARLTRIIDRDSEARK
jgi:signal transduction histidine kinase